MLDLLYRLTEGNPFLIEEVLKDWAAAGLTLRTEAGVEWGPADRLVVPLAMPTSGPATVAPAQPGVQGAFKSGGNNRPPVRPEYPGRAHRTGPDHPAEVDFRAGRRGSPRRFVFDIPLSPGHRPIAIGCMGARPCAITARLINAWQQSWKARSPPGTAAANRPDGV